MMKEYEKYIDSHFPWINKIPSTWKALSLNHAVDFIMGQAPHSDSYNTDGIGEVFIKTGDFTDAKPIIKWYTTSPLVWGSEYDVFICVVGATSGKVNLGVNGTISRSIAALRPKKNVNQKYLFYYLSCNYLKLNDSAQGSAQGIINKSILANIKIPFPTPNEQTKIVQFLDHQTSLIDTIISKKEKLIELLKEKRQAVINEAVTKGLDPTAKMKDSGVEWLGEIPVGWEVVKLSRFGYFSKGKGITKDKIVEEGYACIRCGELYTTYDRIFEDAKSFINQETTTESVLGKKGDVLMAGDGETYIEIGKAVLYNGNSPIYVGGGINVFTPDDKKVSFEFLSYTLNSSFSIDQKSIDGRGDIIVHIYAKQLKEHLVVLPPISTQIEIENYLNRLEQKHQQSKRILLEQIEKLKQYRQSLISEAVTGKIDVREWETKLKK